MRKLASVSLLAVALTVVLAAPSLAGGRHHSHGSRVYIGVGTPFWWGPYSYPYYYPYYSYPYYSYPYYSYPYYYTPPPVVVQEPPVYVQQQQATPTAPPEAATPAEGYWHYCPSAREYYPKVASCPEAWIKVPPRQE